jgi:putative heme-binding domain-containing protein
MGFLSVRAHAWLILCLVGPGLAVRAQQPQSVQWIWFPESAQARSAAAEARYFRRTFQVTWPADEATVDITADSRFTVWLNGSEIGQGDNGRRVYAFDVKKHMVLGKNVLAVRAYPGRGAAGLLVRLGYAPNGQAKTALVSDHSWQSAATASPRWEQVDFDDRSWRPVRVLGPYGRTEPWENLLWDSGGDDRFAVPAGFRVEQAVKNPGAGDRFSLVNLTFDDKGRLLVSREGGPVLLCGQPDRAGVLTRVRPYCEQVRNCQGMCWIKDALFLVGDGPQGAGLYRVRDTRGLDKTDEVKLLHKFVGAMGEHGPHAVLRGPDGWLYVVIGNGAWAKPDRLAANSPLRRWPHGQPGLDQGRPGSTEDVLLPRLDEAHGLDARTLAPGGTIWRLDRDGRNMSLVVAGLRNAYDAAFSSSGVLFTFDSDMEWDEGLPWYRPVRICHCPPGGDFLWRDGTANTPAYYLDSLPAVFEVGRGSPVGMEFYEHNVFPKKYQRALFMGDWSLGVIYAVHLERRGASYGAKVERFCQGAPMNVTDLAVGPDGALYFTMGGRQSPGGVYRIVYQDRSKPAKPAAGQGERDPLEIPQPRAAWAQAEVSAILQRPGADLSADWLRIAQDESGETSTAKRLRALDLLQDHGPIPDAALLDRLTQSRDPDMRAHAVYTLGINGYETGRATLLRALKDEDALVRRQACEALIRAGFEPPVEALWPLLGEDDRFVRTAARLVLQRIEPEKWASRLWLEDKDVIVLEGIIALCQLDQAKAYADQLYRRLARVNGSADSEHLLDYLRTMQLALIHAPARLENVKIGAERCSRLFPHQDERVNRELATLLTYFSREALLKQPVHVRLLQVLAAGKESRAQQIHYFYCLRLLHDGWTPEQKKTLLVWYDSTQTWLGGHNFKLFLENILREANSFLTALDREWLIAEGERLPWTAAAVLRVTPPEQLPPASSLVGFYRRLGKLNSPALRDQLQDAIIASLGRSASAEAERALREIADKDARQSERVAQSLARSSRPENWPYLVRGLESANPLVLVDVIEALNKTPAKPKPDDAVPYRSLLLASKRLDARSRWKVVALLRHWTADKKFGAADGDWRSELTAWSRWFAQTFPKDPPLPDIVREKPPESRYKFEELRAFLTGCNGDARRGRAVFEKAQCIRCHRYGKDGEQMGPDLTTVSKRFERDYILESIIYPSKVISDQYRSTLIVTRKGTQITGLVVPQGDALTVLQSDGSKITLKKEELEQQLASLVSVMPERLLDPLSKQEIADLFAFLESEPK